MKSKLYLYLCRTFLSKITDTGKTLEWEHKLGFIESNGEPKMCKHCGHNIFKENVIDWLSSICAEKESKCANCGALCGYWSYGFWMP